jgi:hypothetical protein
MGSMKRLMSRCLFDFSMAAVSWNDTINLLSLVSLVIRASMNRMRFIDTVGFNRGRARISECYHGRCDGTLSRAGNELHSIVAYSLFSFSTQGGHNNDSLGRASGRFQALEIKYVRWMQSGSG